jgi:hypothetical protein
MDTFSGTMISRPAGAESHDRVDTCRMTPLTANLDALLAEAQTADPLTRIEYRDPIAAHGEQAIDAMTDWLGDPRLAAFAIRVLERIAREPANREAVVATLIAIDQEQLAPGLAADVRTALSNLGADIRSGVGSRRASTLAERVVGLPGVEGRGYWVMRTSPWERPFIWAEAAKGRLRQGWGWDESQNLDVVAEALRLGHDLNDEQKLARRARRMRTAEPDGMRVGDLVVAPNLPEYGFLSVFRLVGSYHWDPVDMGSVDRFGHALPVELLAERIDRRSPGVTDALRSMLRPQTRLYSIDNVGGDVERLALAGAHA